ncbi:MAG: glycosyltransferase family 2 protein [Verrucomicrobia bacterium]|nr:glycosyltransferase family 2 protein [Verrucomicrobiota bacterium]
MNPLVTLSVATLNRPGYFRQTLSSVLAQDYSNLDILVSDNGSRDETPSLAAELIKNDRRARFRRNDTTVPIHEHFTQCLEAARGEFFILLCDDDLVSPNFVSEVVGVATRHSSVNLVVPANVTIDENGEVIEEFSKPEGEIFDGPEFVKTWLWGPTPKIFINLATVLGRTEVMRRFGGYQGFARGQNIDNLLFLQCGISGRIGFAHRALFSWRVYNRSYGTTSTPEQIAESSHEFVKHVLHDPRTVEALNALPAARRKEIVDGVRIMTAREFLSRIDFFREPFRRENFTRLFSFGFDPIFWHVVLHWYYRWARNTFAPQAAKRAASACQ